MRHVALNIHLRLFALRRRRQGDDAENARRDCRYRFDRSAFAGAISAFEKDADLLAGPLHPFLQLDELDMQLEQLLLVVLALQFFARVAVVRRSLLLGHGIAVTSRKGTSRLRPAVRRAIRRSALSGGSQGAAICL